MHSSCVPCFQCKFCFHSLSPSLRYTALVPKAPVPLFLETGSAPLLPVPVRRNTCTGTLSLLREKPDSQVEPAVAQAAFLCYLICKRLLLYLLYSLKALNWAFSLLSCGRNLRIHQAGLDLGCVEGCNPEASDKSFPHVKQPHSSLGGGWPLSQLSQGMQ